jgi:tetratricopeptide (TPR) repeat protein
MAAPDSKPSPTNQPGVQEPSKEEEPISKTVTVTVDPPGLKDPPPSSQAPPTPARAAAAASLSTSSLLPSPTLLPFQQTTSSSLLPTYESSETSENYINGKQLLADGDFEQALAVIEDGILTTSTMVASAGLDAVLHESMAPFHYLYGTTLLYSIEESNDSQEQVTMMGNGDATANANATVEPDHQHQEEEEAASVPAVASAAAAAAPSDQPDGNDNDNQGQGPTDEDNADDMQIAWENLEAARTIVELLLSHGTTLSSDDNENRTNKIKLDLSQILLREGDLQRLNGRYAEAIHDYQSCLALRTQVLPDPYDRRIADAQFNLGLSYLTSASELQKEPSAGEGQEETQPMELTVRLQRSAEHVLHGIQAYVECSKVLCGKIAVFCGADPVAILSTTTEASSTSKPSAGFKTTGLDDDNNDNTTVQAPSDATLLLNTLRQRVSLLPPPLDQDDEDAVENLKQFLNDIQETIDEVEPSQDAVRQASHLKVLAQQAVDGQEVTDASTGVTTSIGFAPMSTSTTTAVAAAVANPWANLPEDTKPAAVAAVAGDAAKPIMMVVKKKKKREPEGDSQPSPPETVEENAAKRSKTE